MLRSTADGLLGCKPSNQHVRGIGSQGTALPIVGLHYTLTGKQWLGPTRTPTFRAHHVILVLQDEEAVLLRIKLAQKLGVLSCSECNLAMLPVLLTADEQAVAAVQVRRWTPMVC